LVASSPSNAASRSFISCAARLVNVVTKIRSAGTPSLSSRAIRRSNTVVLPEPAPASTSAAPSVCWNASNCCAFSPSARSGSGVSDLVSVVGAAMK